MGNGYTVFPSEEVEQKMRDRNKLLGGLRAHTLHELDTDQGHFTRILPYDSLSHRERVIEWKEYARAFMVEIYVLRLSMDAVSQRYFEGYSVLFQTKQRGLIV